jgi:hypothetical protein
MVRVLCSCACCVWMCVCMCVHGERVESEGFVGCTYVLVDEDDANVVPARQRVERLLHHRDGRVCVCVGGGQDKTRVSLRVRTAADPRTTPM